MNDRSHFWTVPFQKEIENEDGKQFAGMILEIVEGQNPEKAAKNSVIRYLNSYSASSDIYNGPVSHAEGWDDASELIDEDDIHRTTVAELRFSNVNKGEQKDIDSAIYHCPEPVDAPMSMETVEEKMKELGIEKRN